MRVPVFHEGTFWSLVRAACTSSRCLRHGRERRARVASNLAGVTADRPADYTLACFQERVEEYELFLYRQLLEGCVGRDGSLRPRSHLRQGPGGVYRPTPRAARPLG